MPYNKAQSCCDNSFNELFCLESIIKLTKNACQEKELSANYYNLSGRHKLPLSEERNHYINMLALALDKVNSLKQLNCDIENKIQSL